MDDASRDIAAFFRLALAHNLLSKDAAIAWADSIIAAASSHVEPAIIELSLAALRPADGVMDALRTIAPVATDKSYRMVAALIAHQLQNGMYSEASAANSLYGLYRVGGEQVANALGREVCCIDEYFEPFMFGAERAAVEVHRFLAPFVNETLPTIN